MKQQQPDVEQYVGGGLLPDGRVITRECRDSLAGQAHQAQQPACQHQWRRHCRQHQQAVENQTATFQQHGPAAFAVGHRFCVGLLHQSPGIAAVQELHQLAVVQVLQQLVAYAFNGQRCRLGHFNGVVFATQAKTHIVGLLETTVVVDRSGSVT